MNSGNSRKRTRKENDENNNDLNHSTDEPPKKKQKKISPQPTDPKSLSFINDENKEDEVEEDDDSEPVSHQSDEDEDEDEDFENDEDDIDFKQEWDKFNWFLYYQYLYDTEHNIDPSLYDPHQYIHKLARNRDILTRDGVETAQLKWNVYICNKLNVDENKIHSLKQELINLAQTNNDWRENEPIQNIIDPDLYVYKYYNKQTEIKYLKQFKPEYDMDENKINKWINECRQKGYFQRAGYEWIASEFHENKQDNCIQISSSIHNISPRAKYENIYQGIEYVFQQMLPLFNQYPSFKNRKNDSFQVIVKSQRYCIEDGMGYKGHWHKEGLTENIIIAGLYYFEKDEKLKGGSLKFRNTFGVYESDDCMYCDMDHAKCDIDWDKYKDKNGFAFGDKNEGLNFSGWLETEQFVETNEGTAIVFDNMDLVHRVKMLKNKIGDGKKRYRSFLAFFIIDPEKNTRISTNIYSTLRQEDYASLIIEYGCNEMAYEIAILICEYGVCGMTLDQAKEIRKKDIELRKNTRTKGKWGVCWGNEGAIKRWYKHGEITDLYVNEWNSTTNSSF